MTDFRRPVSELGPRPTTVCLDLDGVILMSNEAKALCFAEVVADALGCDINGIAEFALAGRGIPRRDKFQGACIRFANRRATAVELEAMAASYADCLSVALATCPLVPGVLELLQSAKYRFVVCTAAPTDEAFAILHARDLDRYFDRVAGHPESKVAILESEAAARRVVFFGDGEADAQAARVADVRFVYVGANPPGIGSSVSSFLPPDAIMTMIDDPTPTRPNRLGIS